MRHLFEAFLWLVNVEVEKYYKVWFRLLNYFLKAPIKVRLYRVSKLSGPNGVGLGLAAQLVFGAWKTLAGSGFRNQG